MIHFWWELLHDLGIDDTTGPWYGFWSGFGSDISEFGIFGILWVTYRKHNCHERWCFRIAQHSLSKDGHQRYFCHKHIGAHVEDAKE